MNCYRYYWMLYILIAVLPSFSFAKKTDAQQVREMIEQVNDAWQKNPCPRSKVFLGLCGIHTGNMKPISLLGKKNTESIRRHGLSITSGWVRKATTNLNGSINTG